MAFVQPAFWSVPRYGTRERWSSVLVTASAAVVSLAEAKLHARIDAAAEDSLIAKWTTAAQQQVETDTGVKLLTQTWDLFSDAFPSSYGPIVLPFGPLISVTHVKSYDSATPPVLQTMLAADYLADVASIPGRIGLADAKSWPTDLRGFSPVSIRVVVGYATAAAIPEPLLQAVRLAIGFHSMNREPTVTELQSYDWLINPFRVVSVA